MILTSSSGCSLIRTRDFRGTFQGIEPYEPGAEHVVRLYSTMQGRWDDQRKFFGLPLPETSLTFVVAYRPKSDGWSADLFSPDPQLDAWLIDGFSARGPQPPAAGAQRLAGNIHFRFRTLSDYRIDVDLTTERPPKRELQGRFKSSAVPVPNPLAALGVPYMIGSLINYGGTPPETGAERARKRRSREAKSGRPP